MLNHRIVRILLWTVPLLLTLLACNTTAQWTGSQPQITSDLTYLSASTPTALSGAACTARLASILQAAAAGGMSGSLSASSNDAQEVGYLVVYNLQGEELGTRDDLILPAGLDQQIDSRISHEYLWSYFKSLIPAGGRDFVTEFSILSDGRNKILAGVSPTYHDPSKWTLKVDIADAGDPYVLTYSLLHEYGHLLTLNASQVPPDYQVFYHPDSKEIQDQAAASCPRYFTGEGCSNPGSYINEFHSRFWSSFDREWQNAHHTEGPDIQWDVLDAFYHGHEDQFLTRYAAASADEDIAESWAYFILSPKPEPTSIASQKILFFYEYPELVAQRQEIVSRLCASFPGN